MRRIRIADLSSYLPTRVVTSAEIEGMVNDYSPTLPNGVIERLFGIQERRFAGANEQVSDMAARAALPIVERWGRQHIGCMIFAAACGDMIEPATANIVQHKLGLSCPVFDVKNACNSFTTAIQIGGALIQSGHYRNVLIVNGEKLQDAIQFNIQDSEDLKRRMAGFALGDAGAAMLLEASDDARGVVHQYFETLGEHWKLCTVAGGGSVNPRGDFLYFEGAITEMREVFFENMARFVDRGFDGAGWKVEEVKCFFMHQVALSNIAALAERCKLPRERIYTIVDRYGNIAAASIPVAMHEAQKKGLILKGDKIVLLGMAAGVSLSIQFIIF